MTWYNNVISYPILCISWSNHFHHLSYITNWVWVGVCYHIGSESCKSSKIWLCWNLIRNITALTYFVYLLSIPLSELNISRQQRFRTWQEPQPSLLGFYQETLLSHWAVYKWVKCYTKTCLWKIKQLFNLEICLDS